MSTIPNCAGTRPEGRPIQIIGTGRFVPLQLVPSTFFDRRWELPAGSVEQECGVSERYRASPGETSAFMGAAALRQALNAAHLAPAALDCIVSTTAVMQQAIPCLAAQIQAEIGLGESGIPAFDINATCLSFLAGLDLIASAVATGRFNTVALVASEIPSVGLDPDNRLTAPLFGDGAAAVILTGAPAGSSSCLLAAQMATYGVGAEACRLRVGGTAYPAGAELPRSGHFEMDGRAAFRFARRFMPQFVATLLERARLRADDLDCVVPHQASGPAIAHMAAALELPEGKVVQILSRFGNQVAASLPNALHEAVVTQRIKRGDRVLLIGTGAGLAIGGAVLVY